MQIVWKFRKLQPSISLKDKTWPPPPWSSCTTIRSRQTAKAHQRMRIRWFQNKVLNSCKICVSRCICVCICTVCVFVFVFVFVFVYLCFYLYCVQDPELNLAIELSLKEQKRKQSRSSMIENAEDNFEDDLCFIL